MAGKKKNAQKGGEEENVDTSKNRENVENRPNHHEHEHTGGCCDHDHSREETTHTKEMMQLLRRTRVCEESRRCGDRAHPFWDTQPVPTIGSEPSDDCGPIYFRILQFFLVYKMVEDFFFKLI